MDKYGDARMKLAVFLRDNVLNKLNIPWTIENGTLLGAWRNGKFILHDDDFDIALFFETDPIPRVPAMSEKVQQLLAAPYKARYVSSYADKIEVYDPTHGEYSLLGPHNEGASYHHCTVDLQFYERCEDSEDAYKCMYYANPCVRKVYEKDIYPLSRITLEAWKERRFKRHSILRGFSLAHMEVSHRTRNITQKRDCMK